MASLLRQKPKEKPTTNTLKKKNGEKLMRKGKNVKGEPKNKGKTRGKSPIKL